MQPSSSSNVFWRQPQHNPHVVQQPSLDDYTWHDPPQEPWSSSYVSYNAAPGYVDPAPAALGAEYLHPSLAAADPFAASPRTRSASAHPQASAADTPRLEAASWGTTDLYRFEPDPDPHPSSVHAPSTTPPSPRVKREEIPTDEFVFELSVAAAPAPTLGRARAAHQFAPMTEVPLRAVNACRFQRAMMSSFRLDPFAMHNGKHGAAVKTGAYGCHVGPLTEPPLIFEFQLNIPGMKAEGDAEELEAAPAPRGTRLARVPSPSPSPSPSLESESDVLQYPLGDEPRENSRWPASPVPYALSVSEPDAYEPIITPAQSLWQMNNYQPESDGSAYSLSPPASLHSAEHSSPFLPPLKPLRPTYTEKSACVQAQAHSHANTHPHTHSHPHAHAHAHAQTTQAHQRLLPVPAATPRAVYDFPDIAPHADEAYSNTWSRKTLSLAMFYTPSKNAGGEGGARTQSAGVVTSMGEGAGADSIPLSSPRWSTMAMRRAAAQERGASRYAVVAR
ncbi:hypothetical protein EIP86_009682 [Pleurotus ostreatoroseus]|nr:hypothetical protein EIP86_009682 [Pleurotus ostreatoroseus]